MEMELMRRRWTDEEVYFLKENWGSLSVPKIAEKLNRTEISVFRKVSRLKLGTFLESGDYITFRQLLNALHIDYNNHPQRTSWITNRGFPLKTKKVNTKSFYIVSISEFWKWAEHNQDVLDFSKLEELTLGKEPEWVKNKRKSDSIRANSVKTSLWTDYEDVQLINLLKTYKYTYADLSRILNRTEDAVKTRILKLGIKYRPLKMDNHNKWTNEELTIFISSLQTDTNYEAISFKLPNRSVKALKSKAYLLYGTQKLNEVKEILMNEHTD